VATGRVDILLRGVRAIYAPTGHLIVARAAGDLWAVPFDPGERRVTGRERALPDSTSSISSVRSAFDLSLSSTGTLAYTTRPVVSFQAVWVDRTGDAQPVAADLGGFVALDPILSADGQLAITVQAEDGTFNVWVRRQEGGPRSRITFDRPTSMRPAWRPGTGAVSFVTTAETGGALEVFEWNGDGLGATRKLDVGDPRGIGSATWSPDGTWLVVRTDNQQAGNGDILAVRPGMDTIARPVIATPAQDLAPAISPDGRWIAYSSDILGGHEIFVSPFPDTRNARYQVSPAGGITPRWSRNGRELFYVDAASNMISVPVPVDPGPTFRHGEPRILFSAASFYQSLFYPQYDVTADAERFVMLKGEIDPRVNVVVVFNFLEELKRIMETP
jgi:Tol biopolymer transport system component